jgi:hypothetical protein
MDVLASQCFVTKEQRIQEGKMARKVRLLFDRTLTWVGID